jgi:hypothetical protein
MKTIIAIAAVLALGTTAAYAQDKSATDKIKAAGAQNEKEVAEAKKKKQAEEDARSAKNKKARDENKDTVKAKVNKTVEGVDKKREANKDAPAPRR